MGERMFHVSADALCNAVYGEMVPQYIEEPAVICREMGCMVL